MNKLTYYRNIEKAAINLKGLKAVQKRDYLVHRWTAKGSIL
jgi:hypothetical protein